MSTLPNQKQPKIITVLKRLYRWIRRLAVAVLLLLIGMLLTVQIPYVQNRLVMEICRFATEQTGREIRVDHFYLSLLGTLNIRGLYIANDPKFSPEPLGECTQFHCVFDPISLLKGEFHARYVFIDQPVFRLDFSEDEDCNLFFFPRDRTKKKHRDPDDDHLVYSLFDLLRIDHMDLIRGKFRLDYRPSDLIVDAPVFSLRADRVPGVKELKVDIRGSNVLTWIESRLDSTADLHARALVWADGVHDSIIHASSTSGETSLCGRCSLKIFTNPRLDFQGTVQLSADELQESLHLPIGMSGRVAAAVTGSGLARNLTIDSKLCSDGFKIDRVFIDRIVSTAHFSDRSFVFPEIRAALYDGNLTGNGALTFTQTLKGYHFEVSGTDLDLARTLEEQRVPVVLPGVFGIQAELNSEGFAPENAVLEGSFSGTESSSTGGVDPLVFDGHFQLSDRTFMIDSARVRNRTSMIAMRDAKFTPASLTAQIDINNTECSGLIERINAYSKGWPVLPELSGELNAAIQLQGSPAIPKVEFVLSGTDTRLNRIDMGRVTVTGSAEKCSVSLDDFSIEGDTGGIKGRLRLERGDVCDRLFMTAMEADVNQLDLASMAPISGMPLDLDGRVSGMIHLNPSNTGRVASRLTTSGIVAWRIPLEAVDMNFILDTKGIHELSMQSNTGSESLRVTAEIPFDRAPKIEMTATNIPLSRFEKWLPIPLSGNAQFTMRTTDEERRFKGYIDGEIDDLIVRDYASGPAQLLATINLNAPESTQFNLIFADRACSINGETSIRHPYATRLGGTLDSMPIKLLLQASPIHKFTASIDGTTTGQFDLSFIPGDLSTIRSGIEIQEIEGSVFGINLKSKRPAALDLIGTTIELDPVYFLSEDSEFSLGGIIDFSSNLDLKLNGMARLNALSQTVSGIRNASGTASFDLNIRGPASDPDYNGTIIVQELYLTNPLLGIRVEDLHAQIDCRHKLGRIVSCEGIVGNSFTRISGEFGIRNHIPDLLDLRIQASRLEFEYPEGFSSEADVDLNLVGDVRNPVLMGDINILQSSYSRRINYKSLIVSESRAKLSLKRKPTQVTAPSPSIIDLGLKLHIFAPDRIRINNNLAKLEMKLDLSLGGSLSRPQLLGRIEAIAGEVEFQGRQFELERATLDFLDADTIDPIVDLLATSEIENYRVSIEMTGSLLKDLFIRPFSSPSLSDVDLWSLLAIGKTTEQLSDNSVDYIASGVAYVTGSLQDQIERRFKYWMGFDELSIDPILSSSDESPSARVTVKKHLNPNLSVTYSRRTASTGDLLIIEYKISDNVYLIGRRNEDGSLGGDFRFRWEFR